MERLGELTDQLKNKWARYTAGRFLQAHAIGKGDSMQAEGFAESQKYWLDRAQVVNALKAAVTASTADDFPPAFAPVAESFLAAMRDASIPLRLQGLRKAPMRTRLYVNSAGVVVAQVAEGAAIPVLKGDWSATTLEPRKFAGITVQTDELMQMGSPIAAASITDDLARVTAAAENEAFIDANRPGSVLAGQAFFTATGSTLAAVDVDLAHLVSLVRGASDPNATFVMSKGTATYLGLLRGTGGGAAFPNIGPSGGELLGLQVLVSSAAEDSDSPSTKIIALLSPSDIFWSDEGNVILTTSKNASLQMSDTPSAAATSAVSMWQSNCTATRAIRESAWYARAGAAAYMRVSY